MIPRKIESKIPESAERYPVATLAGTASPGRRPWFGRCFPMFPARRRKTPNTGPSRRFLEDFGERARVTWKRFSGSWDSASAPGWTTSEPWRVGPGPRHLAQGRPSLAVGAGGVLGRASASAPFSKFRQTAGEEPQAVFPGYRSPLPAAADSGGRGPGHPCFPRRDFRKLRGGGALQTGHGRRRRSRSLFLAGFGGKRGGLGSGPGDPPDSRGNGIREDRFGGFFQGAGAMAQADGRGFRAGRPGLGGDRSRRRRGFHLYGRHGF